MRAQSRPMHSQHGGTEKKRAECEDEGRPKTNSNWGRMPMQAE